jgi:glycosyltransferase involved in cell wall biosynthesis
LALGRQNQAIFIFLALKLEYKATILKRIVFTVTNDLNYDQRMIRICTSLADAGYDVTIVGTKNKDAAPISEKVYTQKRLPVFIKKGLGFYAECNMRLFIYLLFKKADIICCIDLDTMLPVWLTSKLRKINRVYDAHEYFPQQKEIITRPKVFRVWQWIEKKFVPQFKRGYTVNNSIAAEFKKLYHVDYDVIRNLPSVKTLTPKPTNKEKTIMYQGAVNEARGLEFLVPVMKGINTRLDIYGDGNFMNQTKSLIVANNLQDKVFLKGKVLPGELDSITQKAYIGINLVENTGLNQYYSLANKFFDYINNGLPQVSMNFPEYKKINEEFEVAILIDDLRTETLETAINKLLNDESMYNRLHQNCLKARGIFNWQNEEKKLIAFYKNMVD